MELFYFLLAPFVAIGLSLIYATITVCIEVKKSKSKEN